MIDAVAGISLFEGIAAADLERLAVLTTVRHYPRNAIIVSEGDRADTLFLILSGRVKVFVADEDGRRVTLATQRAGEYFGEMSLDEGVRSASVMALEPCELGLLQRAHLRDFLGCHPDAALAMMNNLIRRTRSLTHRIRDLSLMDAYGRLAKLLLSLATVEGGRSIVSEPLTQQEIGERIGVSREMVSRIFKDLKAGGYIGNEGRRLVILRRLPRAR
jgi:CRP/FNR family transcriptional regulator, cyclic AMP receptor protein